MIELVHAMQIFSLFDQSFRKCNGLKTTLVLFSESPTSGKPEKRQQHYFSENHSTEKSTDAVRKLDGLTT